MRLHSRLPRRSRRAVAMVETAMVISVALLFLFGIFEYARFVYVNQVMYNAAQAGARYAVAHTGDGTSLTQVQTVVNNSMSGIQNQVSNYQVTINYVNASTGATVSGSSWNKSASSHIRKVLNSCGLSATPGSSTSSLAIAPCRP